MSHTPGPWDLDDESSIYAGEKRLFICSRHGTEKDATLAAAAPDLLAACEALLGTAFVKDQFKYLDNGIGNSTGGGKAILNAHAAIKKARGA